MVKEPHRAIVQKGLIEVIDGCELHGLRNETAGLLAHLDDFLRAHADDACAIFRPLNPLPPDDAAVIDVVRRVYRDYGNDGALVISATSAGMVCRAMGWNNARAGKHPALLPPEERGRVAQQKVLDFCRLVAHRDWPQVRQCHQALTRSTETGAIALNVGLVAMFAEIVYYQELCS